ncbi:MAG: hypothetical protein COV59_01265 [Candidatus Magasanikbacteria bacterium CG11_big_fil_rev_8_21_14_0_20_39_34]|uniref:PrgI family protein n=1 Tax=Candidatus Magasanikbacteria bacterium CG11_big_fil_rev_8_21_14_0_20_39_34 TaxID=1974653 RepID=A0A2H0N8B8_9BACT|nr:MAG: hypothetical protein COV59_01265 [Candidatus Magasanikbacteria bacterium CG11_big_fil_rev_8_21_14_0_20_39_34]
MQQFVVPQFIDVEDKILGPLTVRQFIILLVGGGIIFLAFRFGDMSLKIFSLVIIGGLSLVFAFGKVGGQMFHYFLLNLAQSARKPSLRIWRKDYQKDELEYLRKRDTDTNVMKREERKVVKRERIRDLALVVNTGGFYNPDDDL